MKSQVEASAISKSQSETISGGRKQLISGTTTKIDVIFPLLDQMCQNTRLPMFFYYISTIYMYYQVFSTSFWVFNAFWDGIDGIEYTAFIYLQKIAWFFDIYGNFTYAVIATAIIFILCFGFSLFIIILFVKNHRLIKWTLTPFKFIFDIISPIMIYPTCAIVGNSIRYLVLTKDKMNWIYLIVGLIMFIYFFALNYFGFSLYAHSTIFIKSPLSCFDLRALKMMPFVNSAFLFFAFIFSLFDSWAMIIVQIAHIAIGLICYYSIIYLPFHTEIGNILFLSVNCAGFINDIIMIILHFLDIKKRIGLIIPFVILVLCLVIFYFVVHFRVKSLIKFLTELEINNDLKEEEKFAIFESIPFFQSEEKAKMSLHIGFTNALEIFYTWSLLRYIIVNYNSVNTILDGIRYTSFFPGESRLLNSFFINITTKRGLSLSQRFFVFEVYKVKTIRQSSVSNDANSRLVELKSISNQCFEDLISFWINKNATVSYFEMLAAENGKAHAKWEESIRDYPNNPKFADEYCSYLIECESNYIDALKMKHRADCIELGKNFASDVTFKSLARSYPVYLKKKIIDFHGNLKRGTRRQAGSARNTENSAINGTTLNSMSSSTASGLELDAEVEDSLAKQLFRQSAIRLGMHRALANRKSSASNLMIFSGIFALIVGLGSFIGLFAYINGYAKQRSGSLTYVGQISNSKFYLDLAIVGTTLKFAYFTGRFKNYELFRQLEDEIETEPLLSVNKDMSHNIHGNAIKSRTFFSRFLESLAVLSNQGKQIYEIASSMMVNEVPFYTCFSGLPSNNVTSSIKAQQSYLFFAVDRASYHTANDSWFHIDEICEIMANQPSFSQYSFKIFSSLNNHQDALCQEEENTLFLLMIIFPIVLFIVNFCPLTIFIQLFMNDANKLLKILTGLDSSMKEDARKPIRKDFEIEMAQLNEKKPKGKKWILFISELILCSAASALVAWAMIWEADNMNDDLKKLTYWHLYSVSRLSYVVEGLHYMLEAVLLNGTIFSNVSNQETLSTLSQTSIVTLNRLNDALLKGVNGIPPCYEYDDELDDINFQSACIVPDNDTDLHDIYRCSSASQGIGLLYNMISTILNEINTTNGDFSQIMIVHSIHLVNCHLLDRLYSAIYRLEDLTEILCDDLETNSIITLVFGIVVSIIVFLLSINFYTQSVKVYNIGLTLTQRVPPTVFISNKQLMNFVLNRKNERDDVGMSTAQGAIFMSNDAILCTNVTGVVEIVNPAVTAILGYTPDQLLGQAASSFFSEKDADTITNQLELMKNGQSSLVYEDHMSCITDSAMEMPCGVTVLGMMNESKNTLESFVIIIRDETILMKQQKDAELAKEQSENLLFQILPRDIVVRLNRGEKDICFTVPSASIIFTDVVRFSEYAKNLQPQEIMGSLSTLFAAFDNVAKKYPLLTKIKLIGDIYMAAAGLFSTENDQPKAHAEQIINFGIDQLTELEEVNVKLNANLQLRIGINSGGPLLAGVLGTDKPVFDIIGDPINVAARLQTTDVPGKIQIPQSTYDLAHEGEFQIEARGEVFLKGKGKTMAYLITPQIGNVMSFDFVSLSKDA